MIYAVSDIHGHHTEFFELLSKIALKEADKLILLGDYIDRGDDSFRVLEKVKELSELPNVVALMGNHERWFSDWLEGKLDVWLEEDRGFQTSRTFLTKAQLFETVGVMKSNGAASAYRYIRNSIKTNHAELISWMKKLPLYYKTDTQIFVHAGVDEEACDWWEFGTPDYVFLQKFPATTGKFYMDIIAGHVSAKSVAGDKECDSIFFDGKSHYYIDGGVCGKNSRLLCLAYDEKTNKYYEFDGEYKPIK